MDPQVDPFSRLTVDQIAEILSRVYLKERLSSCSRVCRTWRTAAARATTSITLHLENDQEATSFQHWLMSHTAQVKVSKLTLSGRGNALSLPLAQLQSLKSLELDKLAWTPAPQAAYPAAQPQPPTNSSSLGLGHLTALTSLTLVGSSVRLTGLSALTGLQELTCGKRQSDALARALLFDTTLSPELAAEQAELVVAENGLISALPKLQCLTSLQLKDHPASATVVAHISSLQSLQQLELDNTTADSFAALPMSLKRLSLAYQGSPTHPVSLTRNTAPGIFALTALQSLNLRLVWMDWSLLASMPDLRALCAVSVAAAEGGGNLLVLSQLTALTRLTISDIDLPYPRAMLQSHSFPVSTITANEAEVLTSSRQLASLRLSCKPGQLEPQHHASLFPPGRHLQHLRELHVGADILRHASTVFQSCPNLQCAILFFPSCWAAASSDDWVQIAAGIGAMSGLGRLQQLNLLASDFQFPTPVWQALGTLSQLEGLAVMCRPFGDIGICGDDVMNLVGCTSLRRLSVCAERDIRIYSEGPPGSAPDVWFQLPGKLAQLQAGA